MQPRSITNTLTITICILLSACGGEGGNEPTPSAHEARFVAITEQFGNNILTHDWEGAHSMFATSLRDSTSADQLAQIVTSSEVEYHEFGEPVAVEGFLNATGDEIDADGYDIPATVPESPKWTAYTLAEMIIEQEEGETYRCYNIGLLWVTEDGKDRIAHFEYFWCD